MKTGVVRIIGGKWRGRKLSVPDIQGLRPTPDRVRETLFNWLASYINGAYCLDVFTGTGVLGFEALSRGASYVEMLDQSALVVSNLQKELANFAIDNANVYRAQVPAGLHPPSKLFDIVFLDPPYQSNLLLPVAHYLEDKNFLADLAFIYLEDKRLIEDNELPANWELIKKKQAGQVFYHLARRVKS